MTFFEILLPFIFATSFLFPERISSFQGSDHDALHEELLHKGIGAEDGKGGDIDAGGLEALGGNDGFHLRRVGRGAGIQDFLGAGEDNPPQDNLQGELGVVRNIDEDVEPAVPVAHGQPQGDGGKDGLGQGEDELQEDAEPAGTVDEAAFLNILRD